MGGIRNVGLAIDCDRCGKTVPVNDEKEAEFYRNFAKRENRDDIMFVGVLVKPGQEQPVEVDFEYLCPKCVDAMANYMVKIDPKLAPPKEKKETKETKKEEEAAAKDEPKKDEPKPKKNGDKTKPPAEAKTEPPPADPEPPPPPATEEAPGAAYDDSDLFD
jgi:hypothetical protein